MELVKKIINKYQLPQLSFDKLIYTVIIDLDPEKKQFQKDVQILISDKNLIELSKNIKIIVFNNVRNDIIADIEFVKIDLLDNLENWRRTQRIYKILGSILMPHIKYSLYFDVRKYDEFKKNGSVIFEKLCKMSNKHEWIQIKHKTALNYKNEYKRVSIFKNSSELDLVKKEIYRYEKNKIPLTIPIYFGAFIFRKHASQSVKNLCLKWAELYYSGGDRDQISLPVAAYMNNFYPNTNNQDLLFQLMAVREKGYNGYIDVSITGQIKTLIQKNIQKIRSFVGTKIKKYYVNIRLKKKKDILGDIKIGWIINGDYSVASSRLLGYTIHEFFTSNKIYSKILYKPSIRSTENAKLSKEKINEIINNDINVLILLKIHPGENIDYLLTQCKQKNILVLYIFCDKVNMELVKKTDATLVISNYYYKIIPSEFHKKIFMLEAFR